jgi:predicted HicB family RNase H-like nuclease
MPSFRHYQHMAKLTIRLDDELHKAVRFEALRRETSLQELVENYLRSLIREAEKEETEK